MLVQGSMILCSGAIRLVVVQIFTGPAVKIWYNPCDIIPGLPYIYIYIHTVCMYVCMCVICNNDMIFFRKSWYHITLFLGNQHTKNQHMQDKRLASLLAFDGNRPHMVQNLDLLSIYLNWWIQDAWNSHFQQKLVTKLKNITLVTPPASASCNSATSNKVMRNLWSCNQWVGWGLITDVHDQQTLMLWERSTGPIGQVTAPESLSHSGSFLSLISY